MLGVCVRASACSCSACWCVGTYACLHVPRCHAAVHGAAASCCKRLICAAAHPRQRAVGQQGYKARPASPQRQAAHERGVAADKVVAGVRHLQWLVRQMHASGRWGSTRGRSLPAAAAAVGQHESSGSSIAPTHTCSSLARARRGGRTRRRAAARDAWRRSRQCAAGVGHAAARAPPWALP